MRVRVTWGRDLENAWGSWGEVWRLKENFGGGTWRPGI